MFPTIEFATLAKFKKGESFNITIRVQVDWVDPEDARQMYRMEILNGGGGMQDAFWISEKGLVGLKDKALQNTPELE